MYFLKDLCRLMDIPSRHKYINLLLILRARVKVGVYVEDPIAEDGYLSYSKRPTFAINFINAAAYPFVLASSSPVAGGTIISKIVSECWFQ